jgi:hypothetical protein
MAKVARDGISQIPHNFSGETAFYYGRQIPCLHVALGGRPSKKAHKVGP